MVSGIKKSSIISTKSKCAISCTFLFLELLVLILFEFALFYFYNDFQMFGYSNFSGIKKKLNH